MSAGTRLFHGGVVLNRYCSCGTTLLRFPDRVDRVLQLHDDANGSNKEQHDAAAVTTPPDNDSYAVAVQRG
jgi:hypothetical protein